MNDRLQTESSLVYLMKHAKLTRADKCYVWRERQSSISIELIYANY